MKAEERTAYIMERRSMWAPSMLEHQIEKAIREAVAAEREACAEIIDAEPRYSEEEIETTMAEHQPCVSGERSMLERLAAAIRARANVG